MGGSHAVTIAIYTDIIPGGEEAVYHLLSNQLKNTFQALYQLVLYITYFSV